MNRTWSNRFNAALLAVMCAFGAMGLAGCENEGGFEEAGEEVDEAGEEMQEQFDETEEELE